MKIIEKSESTSIVHEVIFHKCKDIKEVVNAFSGVLPENIHLYQKAVDINTFHPTYFAIVTKNPQQDLAQGLKYSVSLAMLIDAGIPTKPFTGVEALP